MAANKSHEPSSSSSCGRWRYDVFLSFRGEDTRTGFTDRLFNALQKPGINVFRDHNELRKGENISTELLEAIQDSRISIIVFSRDFAASSWCLEELTKIMECRKTVNQVVFPVFYKVDPSDVRKQRGSFEAAFAQHEERFMKEKEKVLKWRDALTKAANLNGFHCKPDRHEGELIEEIVEEILNTYLNERGDLQENIKDYENFESRMSILEGIMEALRDPNINMVGVYGMGGVGKTMLVKEVARKAKKDKSLFDQVVMAVVSQTACIRNIQGEIADLLGLTFHQESESGRASWLSKRLKKEKSILVILDDIWAELDLEAIGIPLGDVHKGCKIVVTSRSKDVLSKQMNIRENFRLEQLLEEEAWNLFKKMAGDSIEAPDLKPTAFEVAKECAGLPIAVAAVANALKNESLSIWEDGLYQLRSSSPTNIEGMDAKVYSSLKWSYDFLESEAKSLFLLCSLFPEDYQFSIQDFLKYGKGFGLFQGMDTLEKARNRVHTLVRRLKASCLLLEANTSEFVKMHDVLRDVGMSIASKDKHMLIVRNSIELEEWTIEENLRLCPAISVPSGDGIELPTGLECPELKFFLFLGNNRSSNIPDSFFEGMKQLKVLDLTNTQFSSLPSSLHFLSNLQTLCLDMCQLGDITIIGELTKLENLSIRRSDLEELPREIGQLTRLKLLDLSYSCKLKVIPSNIIASLSQLEELYMENSFEKWDVDGNASLAELKHLSRLATLDIYIPNVNILPKDLVFEKLTRYRIFVAYIRYPSRRESWEFETLRTLTLSRSIHLMFGINMLLNRTEDLCLHQLNGIKSVLYELDVQGFPQLKHLRVEDSSEIEYVINTTERGPHSALPKLESLVLRSLTNLKEICRGQLSPSSFCNLRRVEVIRCGRLKNLFSLSVARRLLQLAEISINHCSIMDAIVAEGREGAEGNNEAMDEIMFPQLRSLRLSQLPTLMSFCSKVKTVPSRNYTPTIDVGSEEIILEGEHDIPMSLFNEKDAFPQLKRLHVEVSSEIEYVINTTERGPHSALPKLESLFLHSLPNLKEICRGQLPPNSFCNLRRVEVRKCGRSKNLFSLSVARRLSQLEEMCIFDCIIMDAIVAEGREGAEGNNEAMDEIMFPQLRSLTLNQLPKLMSFCSKVKTVPSLNYTPTFDAGSEEIILEGEHDIPMPFFNEKVAFPTLERLVISCISQVIWHSQSQLLVNSFCKLKYLVVVSCYGLLNVIPSNVLPRLQNMESLELNFCMGSLEYIFDLGGQNDIARHQLRSLSLKFLPRLMHIWKKDSPGIFPFQKLTSLWVDGCHSLRNIFTTSIAKSLVPFQQLIITECYEMEEIVEKEGVEEAIMDKIVFPQVTYLILHNLPQLKSICQRIHISEWPSLKKLEVNLCKNLEIFASEFSSFEETCGKLPLFLFDKIAFPSLEEMDLKRMSSMEEIWQGQFHVRSFHKLRVLKVMECSKILKVFPISLLRNLQNLEQLYVNRCSSLEEVFELEGLGGEVGHASALPQLSELRLTELPKLRHLWKEDSQLSSVFQNLTALEVRSCRCLTHLLPSTIAGSLLQIKSIIVDDCEMMKEIIGSKKGEAANETTFNQLNYLKLRGLPNLTSFCEGSNIFSFPSLEKVLVEECPKLKTFSNILRAPKLEKVQVKADEWLWDGDLNTTIQHLFMQKNVQVSEED